MLFSPTWGLFVFSPFLLFLVLAWRYPPRERGLTLAIGAGVVLQVVLYGMTDWRGGISWGPRFLTDLLPLLLWMLAPVVASLRRLGRLCFLLAVGAAVAIEAIGAFWYTGATDAEIFHSSVMTRFVDAGVPSKQMIVQAPPSVGRQPTRHPREIEGESVLAADVRGAPEAGGLHLGSGCRRHLRVLPQEGVALAAEEGG